MSSRNPRDASSRRCFAPSIRSRAQKIARIATIERMRSARAQPSMIDPGACTKMECRSRMSGLGMKRAMGTASEVMAVDGLAIALMERPPEKAARVSDLAHFQLGPGRPSPDLKPSPAVLGRPWRLLNHCGHRCKLRVSRNIVITVVRDSSFGGPLAELSESLEARVLADDLTASVVS